MTFAKHWLATQNWRSEIQKRIKKLVIMPKETPEGTVLEVKGDVELLRGGDVMLGSSLDGTSQQYIGTATRLEGILLTPAAFFV